MMENPWIPLLELTGTFRVEDLPELDTEQLLKRAVNAQKDAEKEISYGQAISELIERKGESTETKNSLATIGIWHFECAVELFNKALRNYERVRARGLTQDSLREIEIQVRICHEYLSTISGQKESAQKLLDSSNS